MNKYICFYKTKKVMVEANSSYEAQQKAAIELKPKKSYEVTVFLHERDDGSEVKHDASEI